MSLRFGHTTIRNFARIFANNPRILTRHPYMNYLREYNALCPGYDMPELLKRAAESWKRLTPSARKLFEQKEYLKNHPQLFRGAKPNSRIPYRKRTVAQKPKTLNKRKYA